MSEEQRCAGGAEPLRDSLCRSSQSAMGGIAVQVISSWYTPPSLLQGVSMILISKDWGQWVKDLRQPMPRGTCIHACVSCAEATAAAVQMWAKQHGARMHACMQASAGEPHTLGMIDKSDKNFGTHADICAHAQAHMSACVPSQAPLVLSTPHLPPEHPCVTHICL